MLRLFVPAQSYGRFGMIVLVLREPVVDLRLQAQRGDSQQVDTLACRLVATGSERRLPIFQLLRPARRDGGPAGATWFRGAGIHIAFIISFHFATANRAAHLVERVDRILPRETSRTGYCYAFRIGDQHSA